MPEAHQWRLKRLYQFPLAVGTVVEGSTVGWIVPPPRQLNPGQPIRYYGVVRYVVDNDRVAWIESPESFGEDVTQAEQWVRATIVRREQVEEEARQLRIANGMEQ